jgi:hypothetical protein
MKQIITLLIAMFAVTSVFGQSQKNEEAKDIILGKKKSDGTKQSPRDIILGRGSKDEPVYNPDNRTYPNDERYSTRERRVQQINRQYDEKIQSIRNNPTLSAEEKRRIIRDLNEERARKIREVNRVYDRDYDDDDDEYKAKKDKKYKSNNGNRYGWEKGKGNPHRNGGSPGNKGGKGKGKKG